MSTELKRITITITNEINNEVEKLKKAKYYSDSYATIYRHLLTRGIELENESATHIEN